MTPACRPHPPAPPPLTPPAGPARCICAASPLPPPGWAVYYCLITAVGSYQALTWVLPAVCPALIISLLLSFALSPCQICRTCTGLMVVVVELLKWWVHHRWPGLCIHVDKFLKSSEDAVKKALHATLQYMREAGNPAVSHSVGLYFRFYFTKTTIDVSDKMVRLHPNCSRVDSLIGRYTLCISC